MKINYILIVLSFLMVESKAQISSYYYYEGEKIPLVISTNTFSITHDSDYENVKGLFEQQGYQISFLDRQTFSTTENTAKWSMLKIENASLTEETYKKLVNGLLSNEAIKSVQPVVGNRNMGISPLFYVKLKQTEDLELLEILTVSQGCEIIKKNYPAEYWYVIQTTKKSANALELSNLFYETGIFEDIDPGFLFNFQGQCSDEPDFGLQWSLQNPTNPNIDINICEAWDFNKGEGVRIGLLDDGIENFLPPNPSFPSQGQFQPPIHIEFANTIFEPAYETQGYLVNPPNNGQHGTGVFGILAANHNENQIAGIAPNSAYKLIINSISVLSLDISAELANGINHARISNLDILLNEYGDVGGQEYQRFFSKVMNDQIIEALDNGRNGLGMVMVFAAGNTPKIDYPANFDPRIITVGAIDANGNTDPVFARGPELDLVAPGINVTTTAYGGTPNSLTSVAAGTSFAAPFVTGIVALMLSENPCLTVEEVAYYLESTAQKIGNVPYDPNASNRPNGSWNDQYGYGLVDAFQAVFQSSDPILLQDITENSVGEYEKFGRIRTGKNVIPSSSQGDYIIESTANITLKAMKSIHLENGTTIKAGSIFRAYIKEFSGDCNDDWYARTVPNDDITVDENVTDKSNIVQEISISDEMEIFPNPFSNAFNIKITNTKSADYELKILNIIGEVIYVENGKLDKGKQLLTIPFHHNNGVYFVQMRIGETITTQKIMKHE
jgi:subtilisin family serine protease